MIKIGTSEFPYIISYIPNPRNKDLTKTIIQYNSHILILYALKGFIALFMRVEYAAFTHKFIRKFSDLIDIYNIRWISERNKNQNKISYDVLLSYFHKIKL